MIGQTVSHYQILEKLGEGGMGVVYKAHDTELDRDVALKFLPRDLSPSEEERARFIHEAKAASALDHPNICTIYDVGRTPDGQMFIVMGYYKGRSISTMVEKGRLDVAEAVSIAIQIAEGLQAAHEKGIVHRDIKSSNIIVSDKGQVRILDFGLARRKGLSKLTKTGTTVGTASYMSPEQAQGESIDQRTDLWSLGVVLYEMVTGRLPFRGEHEVAILYSVVHEDPRPIEAALTEASAELVHVIHRALEKDIGERYQSAAEMLIDLKRLRKDTSRRGFPPVSRRSKWVFRKKNRWLIAAGAVILLCAAGYLFFSGRGPEINPDRVTRTIPISLLDMSYPGISGDGNWIAFPSMDKDGKRGISYMNVEVGEPRVIAPIPEAVRGGAVDVSPNGGLVLYTGYNPMERKNELFTVPSNEGGRLKKIVDGFGGRFTPDGRRVAYFRGVAPDRSASGFLEVWSAATDGSNQRREFTDSTNNDQGGYGSWSLSYSPDGEKIAWIRNFPGLYMEIATHDLETGREAVVTSARRHIDEIVWVRGDQILYTTDDKSGVYNIWTVPAGGGQPVQITHETTCAMSVRSSADGKRLLYYQEKLAADFWIVDITQNHPRQITSIEENRNTPAFSPDGSRIAFIVGGSVGHGSTAYRPSHIYIIDRDGNERKQLSSGDEWVTDPFWSPDGKRIAYGSRTLSETNDSLRTYVVEPLNPGPSKSIARGYPVGWVDSARVMVNVNDTVYWTMLDGAPPKRIYDDSPWAIAVQAGRYILFRNAEKGTKGGLWITEGVKLLPQQRRAARRLAWNSHQVSLSGDGKTLFSIRGPDEIWRMSLPNGKEERIRADFLGTAYLEDLSPSWDGKEMIIVKPGNSSGIVMIENLFK